MAKDLENKQHAGLSEPNSYWEGGRSEMRPKRAKTGVRGLAPGKFFMTTPFRSLENAAFLENVPLTEAKDPTNEGLSMKILKFLTCMTSKDIPFLIDSSSFLEYIRV